MRLCENSKRLLQPRLMLLKLLSMCCLKGVANKKCSYYIGLFRLLTYFKYRGTICFYFLGFSWCMLEEKEGDKCQCEVDFRFHCSIDQTSR